MFNLTGLTAAQIHAAAEPVTAADAATFITEYGAEIRSQHPLMTTQQAEDAAKVRLAGHARMSSDAVKAAMIAAFGLIDVDRRFKPPAGRA